MDRSTLPLALGLLMVASQPTVEADPTRELAAEAQREFDLLAESVKPAVLELLDNTREAARKYDNEPTIRSESTVFESQRFVDPQGKRVWLPSLRRYHLTAIRRQFQYEWKDIERIARTGR